jgi:hypothetical protein
VESPWMLLLSCLKLIFRICVTLLDPGLHKHLDLVPGFRLESKKRENSTWLEENLEESGPFTLGPPGPTCFSTNLRMPVKFSGPWLPVYTIAYLHQDPYLGDFNS